MTFEQCMQLAAELRRPRDRREPAWRRLSRWICPWRGIFDRDRVDNIDTENILRFTGVASHAVLTGASGMTSGMTPRSISWFKPEFSEPAMMEASGARAWLDELDSRMKETLARGGFYQAIQQFNLDLLWAGCALLFCGSGFSAPLRFECIQIGTFAVALDSEGRLEAVARDMLYTPSSLADVFGKEKMSEHARRLLEKNPYEIIRVHSLTRMDKDNRRFPVSAYFWEEGGREFLRESGYEEMPYYFTAWNDGATVYGTGPGDECLADARQVDELERRKLAGLQKIVDPPLSVPASMKDYVNLDPGAINYVLDNEHIQPIIDLAPFAQALPRLQEEIAKVESRLQRGLMADIFSSIPLDQRPRDMSATEFLERKRESLQQLGPVISAYEPNVLTPLLFRVANTLDRAQLTPPPPQALQGMPLFLKMEFISPMANALRQTSAETTRALLQDVGNIFQITQSADVFDKLDWDQMIDEFATDYGVPGAIVRADDDVAQIRQRRQQEQQQQMERQLALQQQAAAAPLPGGPNPLAEDPDFAAG